MSGKTDKPARIPETTDEVRALLSRCDRDKPRPEDLAMLRSLLTVGADSWRSIGDMAEHARNMVLSNISTKSVRMAVELGAARIEADLAGPDAPPIERMLAEQAALCWVQLGITEFNYAARMSRGVSFDEGAYLERKLSATQSRYLRALEALARVRRLLRPRAVQINVGAQQVNFMQSGGADIDPRKNGAAESC